MNSNLDLRTRNRNAWLSTIFSFTILAFLFDTQRLFSQTSTGNPSSMPHVVVILADDLGYGDPQCYNAESKIPTPHLNRLAKNGLRFTDAHTPSSVCTPTRYGLLTGQYCWRTRLKSGVLDGYSPPLIPKDRTTLASLLKQKGYATACLGKWHLGMQWTRKDGTLETLDRDEGGFRGGDSIDFTAKMTGGPCDVGFDSYFGISASLDMPPYCWIEDDRVSPLPDGVAPDHKKEMLRTQTSGASNSEFHIDDVLPTLKRRTVAKINEHFQATPGKSLFLYLPLNSPHLPVAPSPSFIGKSQAGLYGDFVVETDDFVGGVMDAFTKHNALENTLIIFTSDNGGLWHQWTPQEADDVAGYKPTPRSEYTAGFKHHSNGALRGTKADIYEGGHRVPFLVSWPRAIPVGRVVDAPTELTDILATLADVTNQKLSDSIEHDSCSFGHLLGIAANNSAKRSVLVHHSLQGLFAIRVGDWKLAEARGSGGFSSPKTVKAKTGEPSVQLYNLANDPYETQNVAAQNPDRVEDLTKKLESIRSARRLSDAKLD
jgi:arylsulfatase A